ncbi:hypothetical protein JW906_12230 [bacterium]|nr:hypothetical protein [bacterium]
MQNIIARAIAAVIVLVPLLASAQSFVFSIKPNQSLQTAHAGLQIGSVQPYIGLDHLALSVESSSSASVYFFDPATRVQEKMYDSRSSTEISAGLLIPHIGVKVDFRKSRLIPYGFVELFKSFSSFDLKSKETENDYGIFGEYMDPADESDTDEDLNEFIKDILGFWGVNFGFGVEYPLSDHFSIGGEYGLRWMNALAKYDDSEEYEDSYFSVAKMRYELESELKGKFRLSYAAVSLNFKF